MPESPEHEKLHLMLMLALTFSTGVIDAVGYLGLDRVFTGNMTGNVVILGMGLLGADQLPVIGPVVALGFFMLGAAVSGRVLRPVPAGWTARSTALFGVVGAILAIAAIILAPFAGEIPLALQFVITGALGFAMGMQAGTARHIAVKDVTTVVVTSTLTGLAADSTFGGNNRQPWRRRAGAVILIGLGALAGAAALHVDITVGLGIAALITIVVAVLGHVKTSPAES
ncbi:YoaK family protein [Glaciibacter sp. 2TAF33]|uniref:YoaK family protein n=1 Tax=Glaciibacter sp. 2TAF33 TaxID=3233015 RepID=UPI003F8F6078